MERKIQIYASFLLVLFLMSTSGITVFKHFCVKDGVSYAWFFKSDTHCTDRLDVETQSTCCMHKVESEFQFSSICCSEEVNFYHLEVDYNHQSLETEIITVLYGFFPSLFYDSFEEEVVPFYSPLNWSVTTSERLSIIQSYLI